METGLWGELLQWEVASKIIKERFGVRLGGALLNAADQGWIDQWWDNGLYYLIPDHLAEIELEFGRYHKRLLENVCCEVKQIYADQADRVSWWVE